MMSRLLSFLAVGLALLLAFALVGCSGGNSGGSGKQAQVQAVTVTDNGQVATMEVAFRLSDDGEQVPVHGKAMSTQSRMWRIHLQDGRRLKVPPM